MSGGVPAGGGGKPRSESSAGGKKRRGGKRLVKARQHRESRVKIVCQRVCLRGGWRKEERHREKRGK